MIRLEQVSKRFGDKIIADGITLSIPSGALVALLGKSGEGKSVLLKQIIGLVSPDSGSIFIGDACVTSADPQEKIRAQERCGYVFQFSALLDSLSVYDNLALSMVERGISRDIIAPRIAEKMAAVQLDSALLSVMPSALSGGTRKRVGLARTLLSDPEVILYDEPTTGLDPITSRAVHELICKTHTAAMTSIVVSHDMSILPFVDYVGLLYQGSLVFWGSAQEAASGENPFMNQFLKGSVNGPMRFSL